MLFFQIDSKNWDAGNPPQYLRMGIILSLRWIRIKNLPGRSIWEEHCFPPCKAGWILRLGMFLGRGGLALIACFFFTSCQAQPPKQISENTLCMFFIFKKKRKTMMAQKPPSFAACNVKVWPHTVVYKMVGLLSMCRSTFFENWPKSIQTGTADKTLRLLILSRPVTCKNLNQYRSRSFPPFPPMLVFAGEPVKDKDVRGTWVSHGGIECTVTFFSRFFSSCVWNLAQTVSIFDRDEIEKKGWMLATASNQ